MAGLQPSRDMEAAGRKKSARRLPSRSIWKRIPPSPEPRSAASSSGPLVRRPWRCSCFRLTRRSIAQTGAIGRTGKRLRPGSSKWAGGRSPTHCRRRRSWPPGTARNSFARTFCGGVIVTPRQPSARAFGLSARGCFGSDPLTASSGSSVSGFRPGAVFSA